MLRLTYTKRHKFQFWYFFRTLKAPQPKWEMRSFCFCNKRTNKRQLYSFYKLNQLTHPTSILLFQYFHAMFGRSHLPLWFCKAFLTAHVCACAFLGSSRTCVYNLRHKTSENQLVQPSSCERRRFPPTWAANTFYQESFCLPNTRLLFPEPG